MQPISMVCKVISLQCRGGTRRELFVDNLFGVLMMSVWFYFSGKPLTVACAGLSSSLVLIVVVLVVPDRSKRKVSRNSPISLAATSYHFDPNDPPPDWTDWDAPLTSTAN